MLSDNDTMKLYMQNIGQFPLVSPEEEIELAAKIKDGDDDAKQKLIRSNLRLVVKIAHDFKGLGLPLLDLMLWMAVTMVTSFAIASNSPVNETF